MCSHLGLSLIFTSILHFGDSCIREIQWCSASFQPSVSLGRFHLHLQETKILASFPFPSLPSQTFQRHSQPLPEPGVKCRGHLAAVFRWQMRHQAVSLGTTGQSGSPVNIVDNSELTCSAVQLSSISLEYSLLSCGLLLFFLRFSDSHHEHINSHWFSVLHMPRNVA